jgi:hypothetical protein
VGFAALALALAGAAAAGIVAVVHEEYLGEIDYRIVIALLGVFLSGAAVVSGVALLGRGRLAPVGVAVLVAAAGELPLLMVGAWKGQFGDGSNEAFKALPTGLAWVTATLVIGTLPLVASDPRLLRTIFPAIAAVTLAWASLATVVVYRKLESEGSIKALISLAIVSLAGWLIAPALGRALTGASGSPAQNGRSSPGRISA